VSVTPIRVPCFAVLGQLIVSQEDETNINLRMLFLNQQMFGSVIRRKPSFGLNNNTIIEYKVRLIKVLFQVANPDRLVLELDLPRTEMSSEGLLELTPVCGRGT
jgi:hypothetical protein